MTTKTESRPTVAQQVAALDRMTTQELREKFAAGFGEPTAAVNRAWLVRRVGGSRRWPRANRLCGGLGKGCRRT